MFKSRLITFSLRIVGAGGSALLAFLIAKTTSPTYLGQFQYALTLSIGVAILARAGMDRSIIRFVARAQEQETRYGLLSASIKKTFYRSLKLMAITVVAMIVFSPNIGKESAIAVYAFPLIALSMVFSGFYKGMFKPNISFAFDAGFVSLFVVILALLGLSVEIPAEIILPVALVCAYLLVCSTGYIVNRKQMSQGAYLREDSELTVASNTFMWMTLAVYLQQLVIAVVISEFLDSADFGLYKVAEKLAIAVGFFQSVIVAIYAPRFSKIHAYGTRAELAKEARAACWMSVLLALPPLLVITVFMDPVLGFFGDQYMPAKAIVVYLVLGQFVNVIVGPAALLLNMTGNENITKRNVISFSVLSLPLICLAAHYGDVETVGLVAFLILAFQNIFCYVSVYKVLGILIYPRPMR